jgi:tRNA threonylcarbamoyladenosine biosynthesis protein TsaE
LVGDSAIPCESDRVASYHQQVDCILTQSITLSTYDVAGTTAVARALADNLRIGDVVLLNGGLASGKTLFVKASVEALGGSTVVTSPTFTLAQSYKTQKGDVLHIDTYRLTSIHEFRDLGLESDIDDSITFIEWGSLVVGDFPDAITVEFTLDASLSESRVIAISATSERMASVLSKLAVGLQIAN